MRDLTIAVTVETGQAVPALAGVEQGLQNVEKAALAMHGPMTKLEALAAQQTQQFADMRASLERSKDALNKQKEALDKNKDSVDKASPAVENLTSLVRQYAGPAVIGLAIKQTLAWADSIVNLSKQTGIAPGKLQALEFSAKQVGLSIDPLVRSIGQMSDRLASGDKSAIGALDRLGLSFKNIRGMAPDAAFMDIAKAIKQVEDPMQRAADVTDVFGRTGLELIPLLTSDIDELMKKAQDLGLVMDDETTKSAADLNTEFGNLLDVGKRLIMVFFAPLLPILNALVGPLARLTAELGKMITTILSPIDQLREVAQLLGIIATTGPQAPKGPGATFMPAGLPPVDFSGSVFPPLARGGRGAGSNVLPFERPGYQTMDADYLGWLQQARGPMSMGLPGIGPGTFPGWAQPTPFTGAMEGGLPWASYAGTVGMNAPGGGGGGFFNGAGGRMLGAGVGAMTRFLPGMHGMGSSIGAGVGGALSSLKGVSGMLGSFAPMLGPIAGIAGGLIGKLFGPSQREQARDSRNGLIDQAGGMGALTSAAGAAGVSLDGLMNAKKVADVEREFKKVVEAVGAYEQKLADANAELANMQGELAGVISHAADLGYNFDEAGNLVSVGFKQMQDKANEFGVSVEALGPAFQQQRLTEESQRIIDGFTLLTKGGADVGTVLVGMSDEINKVVNDSLKFGTTIPENMRPWVDNLFETGQLLDENGNKITDLSQLKFGDTVATEFEKITSQLGLLIEKIGEMVDKIAGMGGAVDAATRDRTIKVGVQVDDPNGWIDRGEENEHMSMGGLVGRPRYMSGGGFVSRGTDTVPAMLTPGEGVLRRNAVSRLMRGDWPSGGGTVVNVKIDRPTFRDRQGIRELTQEIMRELPKAIKDVA